MTVGDGGTLLDIDHVHVFVADCDAARQWYTRILGLAPVPELEFWAREGGPLALSNPARTVTLALFEQAESTHCATVALRVSGADFLAWQRGLVAEPDRPCAGQTTGIVVAVFCRSRRQPVRDHHLRSCGGGRGGGRQLRPVDGAQ